MTLRSGIRGDSYALDALHVPEHAFHFHIHSVAKDRTNASIWGTGFAVLPIVSRHLSMGLFERSWVSARRLTGIQALTTALFLAHTLGHDWLQLLNPLP
jgi:hypothetical protein